MCVIRLSPLACQLWHLSNCIIASTTGVICWAERNQSIKKDNWFESLWNCPECTARSQHCIVFNSNCMKHFTHRRSRNPLMLAQHPLDWNFGFNNFLSREKFSSFCQNHTKRKLKFFKQTIEWVDLRKIIQMRIAE